MPSSNQLAWTIDLLHAQLGSAEPNARRLSDLAEIFADADAYRSALSVADPIVYTVSAVESPAEAGQLSFGLGRLQPGRVGDEFYMTKGHLHQRPEAAEIYIGYRGEGVMLLQDRHGGSCRAIPFVQDTVVAVPPFTAHRTINVGSTPLLYLGIYPSDAGHDYESVRRHPFRQRMLADRDGGWRLVEASTATIAEGS